MNSQLVPLVYIQRHEAVSQAYKLCAAVASIPSVLHGVLDGTRVPCLVVVIPVAYVYLRCQFHSPKEGGNPMLTIRSYPMRMRMWEPNWD
jgi:hypothetical protein